ncbi:MAG: SDR family oxidoreductase [Dehalococcoidia bacterium]|nr:MAG: SDR family oxidoreductase [Dehalococcoidia bacterium]
MLEEFRVDGDVAIITGCGSSWLEELASSLAQAGAKVVLAAHEGEEMTKIALAMQHKGQEVLCIPTDLTCAQEIESMVEQTISRFGRIDILVNNLNLEYWKPLLDVPEKEWHQVIDANLTSAFLCAKEVGRHMVAQKAGSIINIVSGLAERGLPNGAAYCASMGGVLQLTRALALEWARQKVRVNAVGVGWMEKPFRETERDAVARYIPMRRRARPEDITPLVVFLASEASSYLSGNIYLTDGGLMARG